MIIEVSCRMYLHVPWDMIYGQDIMAPAALGALVKESLQKWGYDQTMSNGEMFVCQPQ
jgi:hypothetical protein